MTDDPLRGSTSVLIVVAHPDDAEFGMGGTIARFTQAGADVRLCIATNGASGSNDPGMTREKLAEIRRVEQEEAASVLGCTDVIWLGYEDGYLEPTIDLRRDIVRLIRRLRPDLMITMDPTRWYVLDRYINHPDHRAVGEAALAAAMPGADTRLVFTELLDEGLEPYKLAGVWLANAVEPDHWIDITDTMDRKLEALRRHASQVSPGFEAIVQERSKLIGEQAGCTYAEAFKTIRYR